MRSKQLKILFQELSNLNNSFTHYFFVWTQFGLDYTHVINDKTNKLTSDIFKKNDFSKKHNIRLSKLKDEHEKTNQTLLNGIFTIIYSYFENYLKEIYLLAKKIDDSLPELNEGKFDNDDIVVLKVINRLNLNKEDLESKYLLTLDYIRFKRNRLIHQSSNNISRSFREFIKVNGVQLNLFWNEILPKQLQGIDFSNYENANQISYNILIDSLNIVRSISNYLDNFIIHNFEQSAFIKKEVFVEFMKINGYKNYSLADKRNRKKIIGFCKMEYGFEPSDQDLEAMV
ncbi:hypothetical protein K0U91_12810 [Chryseobacterium chendengshani]|uniref:hypothetical protein n=1 Tax=Chryseobacterium sp. LJ668 TaxID=2864040 RepID=UPI001C68A113|nr:hypothetical protein [Chryseobacterium sp. LJ668]MBW8523651.1 hypothetical protein [Chryseobacterium sp. LJ668]QYK15933.1 hypothetical protein K0U91_12810 [Chryseobacterium sp. LJ668]